MKPNNPINNPSSLLARILSMDADALSKLCTELREKSEVKGEYYSPELFWSGEGGPRSDVYTLGLALYEEATGSLPFAEPGADIQARADALGRRMKGESIPGIDGPTAAAVAKALSFRAAERQESPPLLRRDLESKPAEEPKPEFVPDFSAFDDVALNEIDRIVTNILGLEKPMPERKSELVRDSEPVPAPEPGSEPVPVSEPESKPVRGPEPTPAPEPKSVPISRPAPVQTGKKAIKRPGPVEPVKGKKDHPRKGLYIALGVVAIVIVVIILLFVRGCSPVPAVTEPTATPAPTIERSPEPVSVTSPEPTPETTPSPKPEPSPEASPDASAKPLPSPASGQAGGTVPSSTPTTTKKPAATATPAPTAAPTATPAPTAAPTATPAPTTSPSTGAKYELVLENCSWEQAKLRCEEMGGHLATIANEEELNEVIALAEEAGAKFVWLGAKRGEDGAFKWVTGEEIDYYVWDANEPSYRDWDGTYENYLMLWKVSFTGTNEWRYNDVRNDPVSYAPNKYWGITAYICQYD